VQWKLSGAVAGWLVDMLLCFNGLGLPIRALASALYLPSAVGWLPA
jgi:hypothetical protein